MIGLIYTCRLVNHPQAKITDNLNQLGRVFRDVTDSRQTIVREFLAF